MESKKIIQMKTRDGWFFEKINTTEKPLSRVIKRKREITPTNKIRNERGEITTDTREIQRIVENIMNNYMPTNWKAWTKWINS